MRADRYKEAAAFYEPIVRQNYDDVSFSSYLLNLYKTMYICP